MTDASRSLRATIAIATVLSALSACPQTTTTKAVMGAACDGDNSVCASSLCVTLDTETSICSKICATNTDCSTGFVCGNVPNVGQVCVPDGFDGHCQTNEQCAAGFTCDTTAGTCYIDVQRSLCSPCTSSIQCMGIPGVCRPDGNEQTCTQNCDSMSCPMGYTCTALPNITGMQCVPDNMGQTCGLDLGLCATCTSDADCGGAGSQCVTNLATNEQFCATACTSSTVCAANFACTDLSGVGTGPNVCVPNSGTCVGYCDSTDPETERRQCGIASTCDTTSNSCQPKADGTVCAECNTDDDCVKFVAGASCLENTCTNCPFAGQKFCSIQCDPSADAGSTCGAGFACSQVGTDPSSPFFCIPDSGSCTTGGEAVGDDCTALGADACLSGICISLGVESVCSTTCMANSDCGQTNFICCALALGGTTFDCTQPPGTGGGICAPMGGAFGADCSPGQPPCYGGVCLDLGTAELCSSKCTTTTGCPTNFTCQQGVQLNGDGTSTMENICFPSGGGGLGADCTFGPAACSTSLCLQRETGNICTQSCAGTTPCPTGYRCLEETQATDSTMTELVCVPG